MVYYFYMLNFKPAKVRCNPALILKLFIVSLSAIFLLTAALQLVSESHAGQTQKDTGTPAQKDRDGVLKITPGDLMKRLMEGKSLLIVDVRSRQEYNEVHIPGSISVPLEEVELRIKEFPRGRDIVFY